MEDSARTDIPESVLHLPSQGAAVAPPQVSTVPRAISVPFPDELCVTIVTGDSQSSFPLAPLIAEPINTLYRDHALRLLTR